MPLNRRGLQYRKNEHDQDLHHDYKWAVGQQFHHHCKWAHQVEEVLSDGVSRSVVEIQQAIGEGSVEAVFWIVRHLTGNNRGYQAQGDWNKPATLRFSKS